MPGILFFFAKGGRPTSREVKDRIAGTSRLIVSHDPLGGQAQTVSLGGTQGNDANAWLELLQDGLTFDLLGLAGGPALLPDAIDHRLGCAESLDGGEFEAIGLFPGPHLSEGASSLPVLRTMLSAARTLIEALDGCVAVYWSPARSAIATGFFVRMVEEWLEGGPFPAMGLVGYRFDPSGALETDGLDFLIGRELRVDPSLCADRIAVTRMAARIVHVLVGSQLPVDSMPFAFEGRELRLVPGDRRAILTVEPA